MYIVEESTSKTVVSGQSNKAVCFMFTQSAVYNVHNIMLPVPNQVFLFQ